MTTPTFKLYRKPELAKSAQDKRKPASATYLGHVVVNGTNYGIVAHVVQEYGEKPHFEGEVMDWQKLIRQHVAPSTPAKDASPQIDLVDETAGKPFDDPLPEQPF